MGGDTTATTPAPTDYTGAMVAASNNSLVGQLSQTATQQLLGQLMAFNQSQQIMTNGMLGLEAIDAKLEIAKHNFDLAEQQIENELEVAEMDHEKEMEELRLRELELGQPQLVTDDTGDFRS